MLPRVINSTVRIAKGDPKKTKGKISVHAFFMKTMLGGNAKNNPEAPVNCSFQEVEIQREVEYNVW